MAGDAQFVFETNIKQVAQEIDAGLRQISSATEAQHGPDAARFVQGLAKNIKDEVVQGIQALRDLERTYQQVARTGAALPGGKTQAQAAQTRISDIQQRVSGLLTTAGNTGIDLGGLDLPALMKEIDRALIGRVRSGERQLLRQIEAAGNSAVQGAFGSQGSVPTGTAKISPALQTAQDNLIAAMNARAEAERAAGKAALRAAETQGAGAGGVGGGGGGTRRLPDIPDPDSGDEYAARAAEYRRKLDEGTAVVLDAATILDKTVADLDKQVISKSSLKPVPPLIGDDKRALSQAEAQLDVLRRITSGELEKLKGGQFAVNRDTGQFFSTKTGQEVTAEDELRRATALLAFTRSEEAKKEQQQLLTNNLIARQRAGDENLIPLSGNRLADASGQVVKYYETVAGQYREIAATNPRHLQAERDYTGALEAGAKDLQAQRQTSSLVSRLQAGDQTLIPLSRSLSGARRIGDVSAGLENPVFFEEVGNQYRKIAEDTPKFVRAQLDLTAAINAREKAEEQAARATQRAAEEQRRQGLLPNFLAGATSAGFNGNGGITGTGSFDGLAKAAGNTFKYSTLYQTLGLLQQAAAGAVQQFLDANDSITQLQIAMQTTDGISVQFTNDLQNVAALGGFNVGESMDVAASGIRAFGDTIKAQGGDVQDFGESFAQQAARIAVLSNTTLADAAGNLKAISQGFNLPANNAGLTQVTDAIAGANVQGGGDQKQISQGLASSALTLKNLGFSLNEAALLIAKINAETDESGQLIATRLTRIGAIVGGSSGKNFIRQLNEGVAPKEKIDLTGNVKEQLVQIAKIYNDSTGKISNSRKDLIRSALGGEQAARELTVTLQAAGLLAGDIDAKFRGQGAKQFEQTLNNVRAELKVIKGNIDAVITNLANAGLAGPFELLVKALVPLSAGLKDATQLVNKLGELFGGAGQKAIAVVATTALLGRLLAGISRSGGVGNFLTNIEQRVAPVRADARARLAETARLQAEAATTPSVVSSADVRLNEAAQRAEDAAALFEKASQELAEAEAIIAKERAALLAANPAANLKEFDRHAAEAAAPERAAVVSTRTNLAAAQAASAVAQAEQDAITRARTRIDTLRDSAQADFSKKSQGLLSGANAADARGDAVKAERLRQEELVQRERFNARLIELNTQEDVARREEIAALNVSRGTQLGNGLTGGVFGRAKFAASEAEGGLGSTKAFAGSIGRDVFGGLKGLAGGIGVGIAVTAVLAAADDAARTLHEIGKAAKDVRSSLATHIGITDDLRAAANTNYSAADNLDKAGGGFFGLFRGNTGQLVGEARQRADSEKALADQVDAAKQKAVLKTGAQEIAATFDASSVANLNTSIKNLQDSGAKATTVMAALSAAINNIGFAASGNTAQLTHDQVVALTGQQGLDVTATLQGLKDSAQKTVTDNANAGARSFHGQHPISAAAAAAQDQLDALSGVDPKKISALTQDVTAQFLKTGKNLTDPTVIANYKKLLQQTYQGANLRPDQAARLAQAEADNLLKNAKALQQQLADPNVYKAYAQASPAYVANVGAQAAQESKLKSIRTGTVDHSQLDGAQAESAAAQRNYNDLRAQAILLQNQGKLTAQEANNSLLPALAAIDAASVKLAEALKADAAQKLDESTKVRLHKQRAAKTAAEVAKIGNAAFSKDIDTAIKSGDINLILQVFDNASQAQINAIVDSKHQLAVTLAAKAKTDKHLAEVAREAADKAKNPFVQQVLGGLASGLEATAGAAAAAAAGAAADDNRVTTAAGEANPTNNYATGGDGGFATVAQIDAVYAAARAAKARDSLGAARAAVAKAKADYAAAKDGTIAKAQAYESLVQAQNAYDDAVRASAAAARRVGHFKNSAVQQAQDNLTDAAATLHAFKTKNGKDYFDALNAYIQAQRDLADATGKAYFLHIEAGTDLTDPVVQARLKLREAAAKLAHDRKAGAPQDVIDQDRIDVKNAQNSAEAAAFNQRFSDAKTNDELGRISHKAYLAYLQNEHDRLTKIKGKTRQQRDELDQIDQAIKAANQQLSGQFNIGDIKVPTIYEVRRAIANSTGSNISAVQNSVVNNNQQVTVNGADFAKVVDYLKQALGPQGASRLSHAPRKG